MRPVSFAGESKGKELTGVLSHPLSKQKHSPVAQTGEIDCEGVNKENRPPSVSSTHPVNKNSKLPVSIGNIRQQYETIVN
jgi:hypothetical protein